MTVDIVVADDLTGVSDTLVQFSGGAARCVVFPSLNRFEDAVRAGTVPPGDIAIGVSTESRHLESSAAAKRVARAHAAALRLGPRLLFQKVDSALRGNPGSELSAYRAVTGARVVYVSPAFLPSGRTVRNGILFDHGLPLARSEVARDLRTPMTESSVVQILQRQTETAVRLLVPGVSLVAGGLPGIVVVDAATQSDLAELAARVVADGLLHAVAGSAGLAAELSRILIGSTAARAPALRAAKTLVVFGSPHPNAALQLETARNFYGLTVHRAAPGDGSGRAGNVLARLAAIDSSSAGIAFIGPPPHIETVTILPHVLASLLARLAVGIVDGPGIDSLVLSGGDIAAAVCAALKVEEIELTGQVFPGAPLGIIRGAKANGVHLVTKSGAHGDASALVTILTALRGMSDSTEGAQEVGDR